MRPIAVALACSLLAAYSAGCLASADVASAPAPRERLVLDLEPFVTDLDWPVSVAFAPDGRVFFSEKYTGNVRLVVDGELQEAPFATEVVMAEGEGGMLGLALHPEFPEEPWLYAFFTEESRINMDGVIVRYDASGDTAGAREVVMDGIPARWDHSAGILEFGPDGMLYATTGDAGLEVAAPFPWMRHGKVLRMTPTGERPRDNPLPFSHAYSWGHRNVFGLAFDPASGRAYATENGPERGDELNLLVAGESYGWPYAAGNESAIGSMRPLLEYTPPVAPTEATFYTGDRLPSEFHGDLVFGTWMERSLHHVELDPDTGGVLLDEIVYQGEFIIDVEMGVDGHLYVTTMDGIHRVVPKS